MLLHFGMLRWMLRWMLHGTKVAWVDVAVGVALYVAAHTGESCMWHVAGWMLLGFFAAGLARGTVVILCMSSGMLISYRLGCASSWLADVLGVLFMAQGECTSVFSVVLLV
jgi:hypothetical protein